MKLNLESIETQTHLTDATTKLGRLVSLDPRDKKFSLTIPPSPEIDRMERYWITGPVLDQRRDPHCVAYAWTQMLMSSPVQNLPYKTEAELYHECQDNDEWQGNDYDGTSVRAGAKVLRSKGYIKEYRWAFNLEELVYHVMVTGPMVFGSTWYRGMMKTGVNGFIAATGQAMGGHAYLIIGADLDRVCPDGSIGALRILNSWGTGFGEKGRAWLSLFDAARLLSEWGEICMATELRFKPQE